MRLSFDLSPVATSVFFNRFLFGGLVKKNIFVRSDISGVVALGFLVAGTSSIAGDKHDKMKMESEKCYGVAKEGMSDCKQKRRA